MLRPKDPILRGARRAQSGHTWQLGSGEGGAGIQLGSPFKKNFWSSSRGCRELITSSCSTFRLYLSFWTEATLCPGCLRPMTELRILHSAGCRSWATSELLFGLGETLGLATQAEALCAILLPSTSPSPVIILVS